MRNRVIGSLAASVLAMMLFSSVDSLRRVSKVVVEGATLPCPVRHMTRMT